MEADLLVTKRGSLFIEKWDHSVVELEKVLFAKGVGDNLLSLGKLVDNDQRIELTKTEARVTDANTNELKLKGIRNDQFWEFDCKIVDMSTDHKRRKSCNLSEKNVYAKVATKVGGNRKQSSSDCSDEEIRRERGNKIVRSSDAHCIHNDHCYASNVPAEEEEEIPVNDHDYAIRHCVNLDDMNPEEIEEYLDLGANAYP